MIRNKSNDNQVLKIICSSLKQAAKHSRNSIAIPNLLINEKGIPFFKQVYEPLLIKGGFKVKYVNVMRRKQIYVVLIWDKWLTSKTISVTLSK